MSTLGKQPHVIAPEEREKIVEQVSEALKERSEIVFAYLLGLLAEGLPFALRDCKGLAFFSQNLLSGWLRWHDFGICLFTDIGKLMTRKFCSSLIAMQPN